MLKDKVSAQNAPAKTGRKPRGEHIEETDLMRALEEDPAAAMALLADEMQADWETHAPREARTMIAAEEITST